MRKLALIAVWLWEIPFAAIGFLVAAAMDGFESGEDAYEKWLNK